MITGKRKAKEHEALLARIEKDYGVDRYLLLALWGVESAYGDPLVQQNHMRPVFPALAALAWGEPRRRAYWETGTAQRADHRRARLEHAAEMRGSWAGAMGHTQWMPEVWLNVGLDYDRDGRVSPFGKPADALGVDCASTCVARQVSPRRALGLRGDGVTVPFNARAHLCRPGRRPA